MNLTELRSRVRALVDDQDGTFMTDAYIQPLIGQAYDDLYQDLAETGNAFDWQVVELPAVAAGSSNLGAYQATGQPLEFLIQPNKMQWKLTGYPSTAYQDIDYVDILPDVSSAQNPSGWKWENSVLYMTPITMSIDLRIEGEFIPVPLQNSDDTVAMRKNIGNILAYGIGSLIGTVRGNQAWSTDYQKRRDMALEKVEGAMVKSDQKKIRRIGRQSRRGLRNITFVKS